MAGVTLGAHGTYIANAAASVVDGAWRVALGCVAAVPVRATAVEERLAGSEVDEALAARGRRGPRRVARPAVRRPRARPTTGAASPRRPSSAQSSRHPSERRGSRADTDNESVRHRHGERPHGREGGARAPSPRPPPPRRPRPDRDARRLRHGQLWGLHRPARRQLPVKSCAVLAVQADGARVTTVEGLAGRQSETPLQRSFAEHHALQCGYCTPGMLMSATRVARRQPEPERGRGQGRAPGQHLPVHGVLEHRRGRGRGREGVGMSVTTSEETTTLQKGFVGQSVPRKEDRRLVEGQGVFFDDVKRHGMGYLHFVRSPYAHARIESVDVSAALALPGVYGTLTGDEVAILTDPFFQIAAEPGGSVKDYALAVGKVRYLGEPVVAVVAETRRARTRRRGARPGRLRAARRHRRRAEGARGRSTASSTRSAAGTCPTAASGSGVTSTRRSPRRTTSSRSRSSTSTASTRPRSSSTARSSSSTAARGSGRSRPTTSSPGSP